MVNTDPSPQQNGSAHRAVTRPEPLEIRPREKTGSGSAWAVLALFIALGSLAATAWMWWQLGEERTLQAAAREATQVALAQRSDDFDRRLQALESESQRQGAENHGAAIRELRERIDALTAAGTAAGQSAADNAALGRALQSATTDLDTRLGAVESRLAALAARAVDSSEELDLAEIDYLLWLAQERLHLFRDVPTADRALELADRQIVALGRPLYLALRTDIALARQQLAAVDTVDLAELAARIDAIQERLPSLEFRGTAAAETPAQSSGDGWWERVGSALGSLVTVRRDASIADAPVLADQEMIRQRAWLDLETARLAAMRQDQAGFAAALGRCSATLERWFDPAAQGTQAAREALGSLRALDVDPPLPDLSTLHRTLRAVHAGGAGADRSAADADPAAGEENG